MNHTANKAVTDRTFKIHVLFPSQSGIKFCIFIFHALFWGIIILKIYRVVREKSIQRSGKSKFLF